MNYTKTLRYLYEALPMFQRAANPGTSHVIKPGMIQDTMPMRPGLDNIRILCAALNEPQGKFRCIHIAGTNGKGSTSHMLAAILQQSGYRTGLYTSPHLRDFRERIRVNGRMISRGAVTAFVKDNRELLEEIKPSFFEMTVALAFQYFADKEAEIGVIETGLGGRLDSTNIILPILSVITNIGYDHMDLLGYRLEQIASEKAGIIKEGVPVVIGEYMPEVAPVFESTAQKNHAPIRFASSEYELSSRQEFADYQEVTLKKQGHESRVYRLDLKGNYQVKNLKTVLTACEELEKLGLKLDKLTRALARVQRLTHLNGRWTTLSRDPLVLCDTGHNADGLREVTGQLKDSSFDKLHMVIGVVNDKDISSMLELLPTEATYYFCQADIARALDALLLKQKAADYGLQGESFKTTYDALYAAKQAASPKDLIFIGGSTFVVGELV